MKKDMKYIPVAALALMTGAMTARAQPTDTHAHFQSVDGAGASAWSGSHPVTLRGVVLNNPEEWLDGEWDAEAETDGRMGAQWQIVIQAVAPGDRGGTALWMGQNYSSLPWVSGQTYSEGEWSNEMQRVNYDGAHRFRKGDLVDVTAGISLQFGGKRNVNEAHNTGPVNDFRIELVEAGVGLPDAEVITLADVVLPYDGDPGTKEDLFDSTRQTGGEYVQSMRVRIESVRFAAPDDYTPPGGYYRPNYSTNGWNSPGSFCTVTDGEGRYLTVRMPMHDLGPLPADWFSIEGIMNQESGSSDGTFGYQLFAQDIGPTLHQVMSGGRLLMYWSGSYTNYVLEYTTDLETPAWTNVVTAPVKWIAVEEEPTAQSRIYRLRKKE